MDARKVESSQATSWYANGWRMFARNPGMWVLLTIVYFVMASILVVIPLGGLVLAIPGPALYAGLLLGAKESASDRRLLFEHLFAPLSDRDKRNRLLMLGVLVLAAEIVLMIVLFASGISAAAVLGAEVDPQALRFGFFIGLVALLIAGALITMAIVYAAPLVYFAGLEPLEAVKGSFNACVVNFMPLTVAGLIYILLSFFVAVTFGLGMLILFPVTVCAMYASYQDFFAGGEEHSPEFLPEADGDG